MSLLEENSTKKRRVDKTQLEFEISNNKEYKVKGIQNSAIYIKALKAGYLPGLYYLIF